MFKFFQFILFLLLIACSSNKFLNSKLFYTSTNKSFLELSSIYNDVSYLKDVEIDEIIEKLENVNQEQFFYSIDTIGITELICVVDNQTNIESVFITSSLNPKLDSLCLEALLKSSFKKYFNSEDKPINYYFKIKYPFTEHKFYPPSINFRYMKFSHTVDKQGNPIRVFDFDDLDEKPEVLNKAVPVYPEDARRKNIEGLVGVTAILDENGNVIDATLLQSIYYSLDNEAIKRTYECKFKSGYKNGEKVKVRMNIPFIFKLK